MAILLDMDYSIAQTCLPSLDYHNTKSPTGHRNQPDYYRQAEDHAEWLAERQTPELDGLVVMHRGYRLTIRGERRTGTILETHEFLARPHVPQPDNWAVHVILK